MIPDNIVNDLHVILGLKDGQEVPKNVVSAYESYAHMNSIATAGSIRVKELILICMIAGEYSRQPRVAPPPESKIKSKFCGGERVGVNFKGMHVAGSFLRYDERNPDMAHVKIDDDAMAFQLIPLIDVSAL